VGRVLCIANQKGGVGKTTTAVNLAASLAVAQKRALLIDMDPQGSTTSGMGARDLSDRPTTYDIIMGERAARDVIVPTQLEHLHLLPAHRDLVGWSQRRHASSVSLRPLSRCGTSMTSSSSIARRRLAC